MSAVQLGLLGGVATSTVGQTRDPLDRHYTPDALALACCEAVAGEGVRPPVIVEPSVGGGAFARAIRRVWPSSRLIGVDVDPTAGGLAQADEAHVADFPAHAGGWTWRAGLVIGNPPFTADTAIPHVAAARMLGDVVALILPWSCLGGVEAWAEQVTGAARPAAVWPLSPRPWPDSVRETALFLWRRRHVGHTIVHDPIRWHP